MQSVYSTTPADWAELVRILDLLSQHVWKTNLPLAEGKQRINSILPHSVDNWSVSKESDHFVFLGDIVKERVFVVGEECVWNPDFLGKISRQGEIIIWVVWVD